MSPRPVELPPLRSWWPYWLLLLGACTVLALYAYLHVGSSQAFGIGASRDTAASQPASQPSSFGLRSPAVADGGDLPVDYTGDGTSATLPLEWSGAPTGTKSFAMIMHHLAPDGTKWYWIVYDIPPDVTQLPKNVKGVGTLGNNSVNGRTEYAPPHSKGPGAKTYILTVYALSAAPKITMPPEQVNREVLLTAMKDFILARAELHVVYTRFREPEAGTPGNGPPPPPPNREPETAPGSPPERHGP
jgi:Raf kinase inhibitor-like YbhB/YbcL family protein